MFAVAMFSAIGVAENVAIIMSIAVHEELARSEGVAVERVRVIFLCCLMVL